MPYFPPQEADLPQLTRTDYHLLNQALQERPWLMNPPELNGPAFPWYNRLVRLKNAIVSLPDELNLFHVNRRRYVDPFFSITELGRTENGRIEVATADLGGNCRTLSLVLGSLENAVAKLTDISETRRIQDVWGRVEYSLTLDNARTLLMCHGPAVW